MTGAHSDSVASTYVPGNAVAMSSDGMWLLADLEPQDDLAVRSWAVLGRRGGVADVLDVLVSRGIGATPDFVLATRTDEGWRLFVRGEFRAMLRTDQGERLVAAPAGSIWFEDGGVADLVELEGPRSGEAIADVHVPMRVGLTMAATLTIRVAAAPHSAVDEPSVAAPPVVEAPVVAEVPHVDETPPGVTDPAQAGDEPSAAAAAEAPRGAEYEYLFGATQRPVPLSELDVPTDADEAVPPAPVESGDVTGETANWSTLTDLAVVPGDLAPEAPAVDDEPVAPAAEEIDTPGQPATAADGLISALPWLTPTTAEEGPRWQPPVDAPPPAAPAHFGNLDMSHAPAEPVHDKTQNRSEVISPTAPAAGPRVLAGRCPTGHLTPPHGARCRVCGADVAAQDGFEIARPALGVLRLSTGDTVALDRGVLLGRAPDESAVDDTDRPHVIRLASPENDISRNHAEVILDGWNVYLRDLGSTNGTVVTLPGQSPVRLRSHDLMLLEPASVVTLADEVSFTFEVGT